MSITIEGVSYHSAADVARQVGVTRQTLWRWRQDGKVPVGRRYRDKQILFTAAELEQIRDYANRIEPLSVENPGQMQLFKRWGRSQ